MPIWEIDIDGLESDKKPNGNEKSSEELAIESQKLMKEIDNTLIQEQKKIDKLETIYLEFNIFLHRAKLIDTKSKIISLEGQLWKLEKQQNLQKIDNMEYEFEEKMRYHFTTSQILGKFWDLINPIEKADINFNIQHKESLGNAGHFKLVGPIGM